MTAMLYDLASDPPLPGSPLESVFALIAKRRREAEYYKTKLLVAATLAPHAESGGKKLEEAFSDYQTSMFPFLEEEGKKQDRDSKKVLKSWTSKALKIRPLWRAKENKPIVSKLKKGADRVREAEALRRQSKHRRI